jgi:hypothetical protein
MEEGFPDTPSKYAAEGTAMHELARWCLENGRRAEERISTEIEGIEITDDMAELVQGYVDVVRGLTATARWTAVERKVDVSEITGQPEQFGTADFLALFDHELMVLDLKTGYRPVSPVDNTQLMLYALGALQEVVNHAEARSAPVADGVPADPVHDVTQVAASQDGGENELW